VVLLIQLVLLIYMVAYSIIALHTTYQQTRSKSALKLLGLLLLFLPVLGVAIEWASHSE